MSAAEALVPEQSVDEVRESLSVTEKGQLANETRALDARKASCAAPISMGRGEIPVEPQPAAIRFLPLSF